MSKGLIEKVAYVVWVLNTNKKFEQKLVIKYQEMALVVIRAFQDKM